MILSRCYYKSSIFLARVLLKNCLDFEILCFNKYLLNFLVTIKLLPQNQIFTEFIDYLSNTDVALIFDKENRQ